MSSIVALLVGISTVWASPYFTSLRNDVSVPEKCRDMKLSFYSLPAELVFFGRKGGLSMGFSMEYPVSRQNATTLWHYFKSLTHGEEDVFLLDKILNDPELKRDYDIIVHSFEDQDFDFASEGEILEVLAIHDLYQDFPENIYYITGGVEYHESHSPMTIGEVDIFVGRRDTCEAVVVGEVKLGRRTTLNKAKKQIHRFENFLIDHNASGFGGIYKSSRF